MGTASWTFAVWTGTTSAAWITSTTRTWSWSTTRTWTTTRSGPKRKKNKFIEIIFSKFRCCLQPIVNKLTVGDLICRGDGGVTMDVHISPFALVTPFHLEFVHPLHQVHPQHHVYHRIWKIISNWRLSSTKSLKFHGESQIMPLEISQAFATTNE